MAVSYCGNEIKFEELKAFLNLPDKEVYFKIADFIKDGDTKGILNYLNELSAKGMDLHTVYNGITEHFRNLLILKTAENPDLLDESDQTKKQYEEQAKNFTRDQVLRILKVMFDAESRIRYSSNQKILFEALIVELCDLNKEVVDISKLISEIDALKKTKLGSNETSYTEPDPPAETPIIEEKQDPAKESEVVKKLKELFDVEKHNNN